jgi:hypothetical protein
MALDPNIALSYRGVELPNQLAQYAQLSAIQNAQNQNSLAQYQLGAAQRAEAKDIARTNALAGAGNSDDAIAGALLKSGDIKGYSDFLKNQQERKTQALTQQKTETELFDTSMKQIRDFWGNVRTPEEAMAIHDATHKDPIINKRLAALGITEQMGRQQIIDAARDPSAFAQFVQRAQLGAEKFMEMNKPQLSTRDTGGAIEDRVYRPLTNELTSLGTTNKTMTPGDVASNQVAQANLGVARGNAATSAGQLQVAKERLALDKDKGTPLTESQGNATAFGMRMMESNKILKDLEDAGKKDTGVIKGVVGGALGLTPFIGEKLEDASGSIFNALPQVLGGLSPEQQKVAQARINFITALLRKESGAAIGASEFATAERNYFPKPGEGADVIKQKQKARETAIKAMQIQAGPGARQMGGGGLLGASENNPLGLPGL